MRVPRPIDRGLLVWGMTNETPRRKRASVARRKRAFIAAFALDGNVTAAAAAVPIDRGLVYAWRKDDPEFEEAFLAAQEAASDLLEQEARRRAYSGVDEPVIYQGALSYQEQGIPLTVKKYSDVLLIFLLKGAKPEKYRERYEHSGPGGKPIEVADARAELLRRLAPKSASDEGAGSDQGSSAEGGRGSTS